MDKKGRDRRWRRSRKGKNHEPGRIRTFDPQIKSLLLYLLSYWPLVTGLKP